MRNYCVDNVRRRYNKSAHYKDPYCTYHMFVCLRVYTSASLFRQSIVFCSGYVIDSIASLNRERQKESGKNAIFVHEYVARINLQLHTRLYAGNRKSCLNANECKAAEKRVSSITRFFYVSVKTNDRSKRAERQYEYCKKKNRYLAISRFLSRQTVVREPK